jgi:hypothetical protein
MKPGIMLRTRAGMLFALLAIAAQPSAWGQTFTTFDPPGSQGTSPVNINPAGQITGSYFDANFATHGFVRATDGTITSFDAPGAAFGTFPSVITPLGLIVGTYFDGNFGQHIFLRTASGAMSNLDVPNAVGFPFGLFASSEGEIAGNFFDSNFNNHGFLRTADGKITVFDFPPVLTSGLFLPALAGINAGGVIVGGYSDANFVGHGFLRATDGTVTTFDVPNEALGIGGIQPNSINNAGTVAGTYYDTTKNLELRVFLRASNGAVSSFATPPNGSFGGVAVNSSGAVVGYVFTFSNCTPDDGCSTEVTVSFLRSPNGTLSTVSPPGAQGTQAVAINPVGVVTGNYTDGNGVAHGFVRKP